MIACFSAHTYGARIDLVRTAKSRPNRSRNRRQHWVPESYLDPWRIPDDPQRVHLFRRDGTSLGRKFARGLFREDDLYTRVKRDGGRDVGIENGLAELEGRFGEIRPKFAARQMLTGTEYAWLLAFICALHARTPVMREHDRSQWGQLLSVCRKFEADVKSFTPAQQSTFARAQAPRDPSTTSLTVPQVEAIVRSPLQTLFLPRLAATMKAINDLKMSVTIFCATPEHQFVTSDAPCFWYDEAIRTPRDVMRWAGMKSPTFELMCRSHRTGSWCYHIIQTWQATSMHGPSTLPSSIAESFSIATNSSSLSNRSPIRYGSSPVGGATYRQIWALP